MPNLSQLKRQRMLEFLQKIRTEHTDDESLIAINEIETALNEKKYGLVWEEHEERVDIEMQTKVPVFTEVTDREIVFDGTLPYNFLLEGDNLHSLYLLEKTHKGMIDVICIDPPYNRGKQDFKYDDNFIEASDDFRHSKWISFMEKRLKIMQKLLSSNGVIIINIDEHEMATLIMLCQQLFGDENVDSLVWQKTDSKVDRNTNAKTIHRFKSIHESVIICYKNKNKTFFNKMMRLPEWKNKQTNPDNDPRGAWSSGIISFEEGHKKEDKTSENYYTIITPSGKEYTRHWFVPKEEFQRLVDDNRISFPKNGDGVPRLKTFENEEKEYYMDSIIKGVGTSSSAKDELLDLFGDREIFDTPKPTKLIKELIRVSSDKQSIILDCFAGSGTTAQAIIELNNEDMGNRKFILCTNNEKCICEEVTYPRVKTVILGIKPDGTVFSNGIAANLKYYKTDFIDKYSEDENYSVNDNLLSHIAEMVQLEYAVKLDGTNYVLIMSDEEADTFIADSEKLSNCKALYISTAVLLTSEQQETIKRNNINVFIIPDYYFESELLEVGER